MSGQTKIYNFVDLNGIISFSHRRGMELEDKAKVVTSVWGAEFVQFLAALAVLPRSIWKI